MASENPDVVEFELEADVYKLERGSNGVVKLTQKGQTLVPDLASAKIAEDGEVTLQGRQVGKVNAEATGDIEALKAKLSDWFPPGAVHHVHTAEKFHELNTSGIVVGKFSAKWCGPCKMVAPKVEKMSLEFPDVTFIHMDEDEIKDLFNAESIQAYPTFKIYVDGKVAGAPIQGANLAEIENRLKALGVNKVVAETSTEEIIPEDVVITCERDQFRIEKTEEGAKLIINGEVAAPAGKCPAFEINRTNNKVSFGRGGGQLYVGENTDVNAIADALEAMFPSYVTHIHSTEQFDEIKQSGITCAKFSAEWCGPCKQIAGIYNMMAEELQGQVTFLHIDVDEQQALMKREGVSAMPTFQFWMDGVKKPDMNVRGANIPQLVTNIGALGVDVMPLMSKFGMR